MVYIKVWNRYIMRNWIFFIAFLGPIHSISQKIKPIQIIFEGDFASDVEDIGTLAMLNALENQGQVQILAIISSTNNPYSGLCISAINQYYSHGKIPQGILKRENFTGDSKFRTGYSFNKNLSEHYPHNYQSIKNIQDAVGLLRKILSNQNNEPVYYISSGNLSNLKHLLNSKSDFICPQSGGELIRKKIKLLIITNGAYPKNESDYHFLTDIEASTSIAQNWPGNLLYIGHELDKLYTTGPNLQKLTKDHNPIRDAYLLWDKKYFRTFEPSYKGNYIHPHPSRAQIGIYYLIHPTENIFKLSLTGGNFINSDGANYWIADNGRKDHYLISDQKSKTLGNQIEKWMGYNPKK